MTLLSADYLTDQRLYGLLMILLSPISGPPAISNSPRYFSGMCTVLNY